MKGSRVVRILRWSTGVRTKVCSRSFQKGQANGIKERKQGRKKEVLNVQTLYGAL